MNQSREKFNRVMTLIDTSLLYLNNALKHLGHARGLGVLDIFNGGFFVTFAKRYKIDKAQKELDKAKISLRNLRYELEGEDNNFDLELDVVNFFSIIDYIFDNAFTDFAVQTKIKKGIKQINESIDKLEEIKLYFLNYKK